MAISLNYKTFNTLLRDFLLDLTETFPEYPVVQEGSDTLHGLLVLDENNAQPLEIFMAMFGENASMIMAKDADVFASCELPFVGSSSFNFATIWPTLDDDNKEAIWSYMQQLYLIGTTVSNLSPDLLSVIEGIAEKTIQKVNNGELSSEDAQNPMTIMSQIMQDPDLMASLQGAQ
jgi:hypothetical protein